MNKTLLQKKGFSFRKHTIQNNSVLVETKTLRHYSKFEIKLDKLGFDLQYYADNVLSKKIFYASILGLMIIFGIIEIIHKDFNNGQIAAVYFCFACLLLLSFLKEPADDIYLTGGAKNLVFYRNKPSEEKVLEFIDELKISIKKQLKITYLSEGNIINEEDHIHTLHWLKDKEIITTDEFEELKKEFEIKRLL